FLKAGRIQAVLMGDCWSCMAGLADMDKRRISICTLNGYKPGPNWSAKASPRWCSLILALDSKRPGGSCSGSSSSCVKTKWERSPEQELTRDLLALIACAKQVMAEQEG